MVKIHLSKILGEKRINQAQLSRKTGIRPNTICDMYNEICDNIKLEHIDNICKTLDCDIDDLIEYIPDDVVKEKKKPKKYY